jgi:hypothetical protein
MFGAGELKGKEGVLQAVGGGEVQGQEAGGKSTREG